MPQKELDSRREVRDEAGDCHLMRVVLQRKRRLFGGGQTDISGDGLR